MVTKNKKASKVSVKFDYKSIKSFEDACKHLNLDPLKLPDVSMLPVENQKSIIAAYKLHVIYKAINNGWKPDWSNHSQYKYYPWYFVLSSGFGFSHSYYDYTIPGMSIGSRLCTNTSEKALYIAKQFETEYKDFLLFSE